MSPFQHFVPDESKIPDIQIVRSAYKVILDCLYSHCPPSRERSVAITELETSAMWAIKSIALPRE